MMAVVLHDLLADLREEAQVVDDLLSDLPPSYWQLPTLAKDWSVSDQVSHLAYFDEALVTAVTDPETFRSNADALMAHGPDFAAYVADQFRSLAGPELLEWFQTARKRLLEVFAALDGGERLPWYGPPMSTASAVTARLMETWAHGQDIAGALEANYPATMRLRHIAHLGVRTFGFAFELRGLPIPSAPLRVDLAAPDGTTWTWGTPDAVETVSGSARDFCLVVTQRCHRDDTELVTTGPVGARWLSLAQAYAGPPGSGRGALGRSIEDCDGVAPGTGGTIMPAPHGNDSHQVS
jgi:uncharacterized protein (TIGR03084 family)